MVMQQHQSPGRCWLMLAMVALMTWAIQAPAQQDNANAPQQAPVTAEQLLQDLNVDALNRATPAPAAPAEATPAPAAPAEATPAPAPAAPAPVKPSLESIFNYRIRVKNFTTLKSVSNVESIAWSPDGKTLLVDSAVGNPYYNIYLVEFDAEGRDSIRPAFQRRGSDIVTKLHNGNASWHPKGRHIVFSGQNVGSTELRRSAPGYGLFSNLWVADDSGRFWRITNLLSSYFNPWGVSMPHFSPDGRQLVWTVSDGRLGQGRARGRMDSLWGTRALCLANFSFKNGEPQISKKKEFTPGEQDDFYESYGFSNDGSQVLFAANMSDNQPWFGMDICLYDIASEQTVKLTDTPLVWDRYASFSPRGEKIVWSSSEGFTISSLGVGGVNWQREMISELWIMNKDGGQKRRLTFFNQRNRPESVRHHAYVGMSSWHPSGERIALVLHNETWPGVMESSVMILDLYDTESDR
ncbi:MAG: hypothetical protein GX574_13905 [Lentisphaerae bacterium]|nr:hypothetical protein [Lentisphaerota bacterium]OQC17262.1 MAG: translocation protein TolB [Lentisphaerae bacterium ADurb.Bin082]